MNQPRVVAAHKHYNPAMGETVIFLEVHQLFVDGLLPVRIPDGELITIRSEQQLRRRLDNLVRGTTGPAGGWAHPIPLVRP